jgi:hypothetical protein
VAGRASGGRARLSPAPPRGPPMPATDADATSAQSSRTWPCGGGRTLFELQGAASALPADRRHPGHRRNRGHLADSARRGRNIRGIKSWGAAPPRKMGTRAAGVDSGRCAETLPVVEQHVNHARAHLPRRRKRTDTVTIADDLPLAAEETIDRERQPDGKSVHAAAGAARFVALDDEVPVVLLDGEVDDADPSTDARLMAGRSAPNTRADLICRRGRRWVASLSTRLDSADVPPGPACGDQR